MSNKKYRFYLIKSTFFLFIEERLPTTNICFLCLNHFLYFNRITVQWNHITFHIIYHIVIYSLVIHRQIYYMYLTLKYIFTSCLPLKLSIWTSRPRWFPDGQIRTHLFLRCWDWRILHWLGKVSALKLYF